MAPRKKKRQINKKSKLIAKKKPKLSIVAENLRSSKRSIRTSEKLNADTISPTVVQKEKSIEATNLRSSTRTGTRKLNVPTKSVIISETKTKSVQLKPKPIRKKVKSTESKTGIDESNEMDEDWMNAKSVYDFTVNSISGEPVSLEKYKGYVLLIVNVASRCGLTSTNYSQLVALDEKFKEKGLRILAFPCNQFAGQEPGSNDQICDYVKKKNVNFDVFEKIQVNGNGACPLYKYLKHKQPGMLADFIKWNFTKFIVNREGQPVERHAPTVKPETLIPNIEKYL